MEFHKTIIGKRFYDSDLPRLIDSLNKLTSAIEKSNVLKEKGIKEGKLQKVKDLKAQVIENKTKS
jgi:hypothetical protein